MTPVQRVTRGWPIYRSSSTSWPGGGRSTWAGRFSPGGVASWVAPARNPAGEHLVLKVGWCHDEALHEADGLRVWDGDGAVRLIGDPTGFAQRMADLLGLDVQRLRQWLFARCVPESVDQPHLQSAAIELAP